MIWFKKMLDQFTFIADADKDDMERKFFGEKEWTIG